MGGGIREEEIGADRGLGAGQGRQRKGKRTQETVSDTGARHRAQRREVEADGWQVWAKSSCTAFRSGKGGGGQV